MMKSTISLAINARIFSMVLALHSSVSVAANLVATDGTSEISVADIRTELSSQPADVRARVTADNQSLAKYIAQLLKDQRIAIAAQEAGIEQLPEFKAAVARSSRDILLSKYLNSFEARAAKSAPDFRSLAKERYEANKHRYIKPEAVRVAHILIRVDVEDERVTEAERRQHSLRILDRARLGENFAALAKEYSEDKASASMGGDLPGWIERDKTVPPFERAAFGLEVGEISGLVRTRFGFHIIKLLDRRKPAPIPFPEVEQQLAIKLRAEYLADRRAENTKRFDGQAPVVIDDDFLNAVKGQ